MKNKKIGLFGLTIVGIIALLTNTTGLAKEVQTGDTYAPLMSQGDALFQQGYFQAATKHWEKSLALFDGNTNQHINILTRLAAAYQNLGMHSAVFQTLEQAISLAEKTQDVKQSALVLSQLSDAWLSIGESKEALLLANNSIADARKAQAPKILARALNNQGNALIILQNYPEAIKAYNESAKLAKQVGDLELAVRVSINRLKAEMSHSSLDDVIRIQEEVYAMIGNLPYNYEKANSLVSLGRQSQFILQSPTLAKRQKIILSTYQAFMEAVQIAKHLQNNHLTSIAYGYLGQLYEQEHRLNSALSLTRQAIFFAKQGNNPHILYRWYWQQGRIFKAQGELEAAIAAYRLASVTLKPIQSVLEMGYRTLPGTFDEVVKPVYYGLADLLLQKAAISQDAVAQQRFLKEAVATVELVKVAELQDYFQDDCILALQSKATELDYISSQTAILYPIPLQDRLVIIVSITGKFHQTVVPVNAEQINQISWDLRVGLQTRPNNRFIYHAWQLYDWLIRPIETLLTVHQIDTLVVVPDGKLRLIPFSTLHDGKHFLIEKYAIALTPGLTLLDPKPIRWDNSKILLIGLSEAVQEYPPLPNVLKELQSIQDITQGIANSKRMLNAQYSIENFRNQLRTTEYSVIHLATHAEFNTDPEQTYLLTYQEKMTMNELQEVIGLGQFRENSLELLTLSACQTAVGDDRAALGLAGVAIKAGARSALATLWFIDDEATSIAVTEFYRQLVQHPGHSKAKALQNVQKKLIAQIRYWHPSYWAPFLLIGNWL
ncbi:MAG: hypothetical protein DRQ41_02935 [Gammaproteobacteria bacterium]|nr:MAG: hypothetical protein DRQ41_02935 [Gammaproteobacteria bacterium]RKZ74721.1 MAG: hypothetical protein DRQ57_10035 [Gammaproteobacteria bacterium]